MSQKLKDEELKEVQELNQKFLQIKVKMADVEINKQKSVTELESVQKDFVELEKKLIESYGQNAVIDLRTGEVKDPETPETDGKDK